MQRILVTGGTGVLGNEIIPRLVGAHYQVRVMSRSASQLGRDSKLEWAQADLATGTGLSRAVRDVDIVLNLATSPFENTYDVDVEGTHTLLEYARRAGVKHVMHVSLVGSDEIDHPYFHHKQLSEEVVEGCGIAYTLLRTTHFHSSLDALLKPLRRWAWSPILPAPSDFQFQTIHVGEVADHLMGYVGLNAAGRLPEIGGPEVRRLGDMVKDWLAVQGVSRPVIYLPLPGSMTYGVRGGFNTVPAHPAGTITWNEWLYWKYQDMSQGFQLRTLTAR
jgi:uncharacterized protein YbjT (DUF2867 family)